MGPRLNTALAGKRFGKLVAVRPVASQRGTRVISVWECACDCGASTVAESWDLTSGSKVSCGCKRLDLWYAKAFAQVLNRYKQASRKRSLAWALSDAEAVQLFHQDCHYCGQAPANQYRDKTSRGGRVAYYNGIDRVDNGSGYIAGNVVACCVTCNMAKKGLSRDQFLSWVRRVAKHQAALARAERGPACNEHLDFGTGQQLNLTQSIQ